MKKICKLAITMFMIILILSSNLLTARAATAADNIVVNTTEVGKGNNPLKVDRTFAIKKTSDGKYMYCMDYHMLSPKNITYKNQGLTTDNGVAYILTKGVNVDNDYDYFITQMSLWIYLLDNNLMQDSSYGSIKVYRNAVYSATNDSNQAAVAIRKLVSDAKSATKINNDASLTVDDTATFTLKDDEYKTSIIKVNTTASDYEVKLENAPNSAKVEKTDGGFTISVPASSITSNNTNIKAVITASQNITSVYVFKDPNGVYQPVSAPYTNTVNLKKEINLSITSNIVSIIKRDKDTNKILEGATLVLTDESGKELDKWVTTTTPHIIYNLANGKYIISEIEAPDGYILNEEKLIFDIKDEATSQTITFYNEKEETLDVPEEEITTVPVESTGMNKSAMVSVIGITLITAGATLIYRKTKENN